MTKRGRARKVENIWNRLEDRQHDGARKVAKTYGFGMYTAMKTLGYKGK